MTRAIIETPSGTIESMHVVWQDKSGRDVYVWAVGDEAYEFPSAVHAQDWLDHVWASDPRAKEECGWTVRQLEEDPNEHAARH